MNEADRLLIHSLVERIDKLEKEFNKLLPGINQVISKNRIYGEKDQCGNKDTLLIKPIITNIQYKEQGFINWTNKIVYEDRKIILPDNTQLDAIIWLDNQNRFDNGSYTTFLSNYYYDNVV